jgi:hypothetical protein
VDLGIAFVIMELLLLASGGIPFLLARRKGWRTATTAVATWAAAWIVILISLDAFTTPEAIGIALVPITLPWLIGLLIGAAGGSRGKTHSPPTKMTA